MDISRQVTERLIKYGELLVHAGAVLNITEFAKAGGMTITQWYMLTKSNERNFTIEQLAAFGKRFNLNMNYLFFGIGEPQLRPRENTSVIEILKMAIVKLEVESLGKSKVNTAVNTKVKKK